MLDIIIETLKVIIIVSAIGSFVTLLPLFKTLNVKQKTWLTILLVSLALSFFIDGIPDMIRGFMDGISGK
ncbi:hypothetical protein [Leuconostoc lactis]|uniref:hypothetical protein n=1 Tax=Leuconostoc lactis TaxID=1246 RepID=UPI000814D34F|nr:hypothetical protein [Leuconostoc lactis]ANY12166.1 hypothetical protein BCR17_07185 [Leuconostoc lactis]MSB65779.1 hypothetical protein [Leuconostoc lactis]RYS91484.1 hypothetical protein EAI73_00640 [Leuconostoc lactis]